jgi:2-polyprenyl-3-methyl-5-hydroxy-6-metoxy-1,4-benzoquinol methylase
VTGLRAAPLVVGRHEWEAEFRSARWDRLREAREQDRFTLVAQRTPAAASVLDLGCAQAPLLDALLARRWHGRYVGVDWSLTALRQARARHPAAALLCADIGRVVLRGRFDVVVLGEVLYYLPEPVEVLRRCRALAVAGGRVLVSVYRAEPRTPAAGHRALAGATAALLAAGGASPAAVRRGARRWDVWELGGGAGGAAVR